MLKLKNPKYYQAAKLGLSTWFYKQFVQVPTLRNNELICNRNTKINLYDNQKPVFDYAKNSTACLIEAQTGFGKTVVAIALHDVWGGKTLVACHTLDLAKQFAMEFEKFLGIKASFYCGGKQDLSGEVVITTHATLRKKEFQDFDNLIIDEADLMATSASLRAILKSKAKRKVAFTGTTWTPFDDWNDGVFLKKFWNGYIKGAPQKSPLKNVYYHIYNKVYYYLENTPVQAYDWHKFRKFADEDLDRKKAQLEFIKENSLILFDRVEDVNWLFNNCKSKHCYKVTGQMKKQEREKNLKDFKANGGYLFATASTLNRGYDNVKLDKVFIMYPLRGENSIRQTVGRVMRYFEGKESYVYFWIDSTMKHQLKTQKLIIEKYYNLTMQRI